jgi:hypothetical protein
MGRPPLGNPQQGKPPFWEFDFDPADAKNGLIDSNPAGATEELLRISTSVPTLDADIHVFYVAGFNPTGPAGVTVQTPVKMIFIENNSLPGAIQYTTAHEAGHCLGEQTENKSSRRNLMHPDFQPELPTEIRHKDWILLERP